MSNLSIHFYHFNLYSYSFYEGPCTGNPPVVIEFLPTSTCIEDYSCQSLDYQQRGFNSPVNKTVTCTSGIEDVGITSPQSLNQQYAVPIQEGSSSVSQSIFSTGNQYFSTSDVQQFQSTYDIPVQSITTKNAQSTTICYSSVDCSISNLEVEYLSALSQRTNTTYWYVNSNDTSSTSMDVNLQYLIELLELSQPPMVNLITYAAPEQVNIYI